MSELEQQSLGVRASLSTGTETELNSQWKHEATLGLLLQPLPTSQPSTGPPEIHITSQGNTEEINN